MVISPGYLLPPNIFPISPIKPVTKTIDVHCSPVYSPSRYSFNTRESKLPAVATISCPPIDAGSLENEFSGHGVTFSDISDSCVVKMAHENGSVAKVLLPSGLITSYKPLMWHGGTMELLHTSVSKGENDEAFIHGGVSLAFTCDSDGTSWSPRNWDLREVEGNPQESIRVELSSKNVKGDVEVKHIITLREDVLASQVTIRNSSTSPLKMMGSILSHLTVSTPEATYAIGLQGSDFFSREPVLTDFSLIHPGFGKRNDQRSRKTSSHMAFMDFFSSWNSRKGKHDDGSMGEETLEGEEDDNYKCMAEETSKVYTSAPRSFTIIDRGRRNSVVVRRDGFDELYMLSPGSSHEWHGKYAYVCLGQAALLQPITLGSHSKWKGEQYLCNPNL